MVYAIWAVGLLSTHEPSSTDDAMEHIQSNTEEIRDWLTCIAKAILAHRESPGYLMQKQKSGQTKQTGHGLTAAEQEETHRSTEIWTRSVSCATVKKKS